MMPFYLRNCIIDYSGAGTSSAGVIPVALCVIVTSNSKTAPESCPVTITEVFAGEDADVIFFG